MKSNLISKDEIAIYTNVQKKIGKLVNGYFDEFIKCNSSYELRDWNIQEDLSSIRIEYSCIDYCYNNWIEDTIVTLDELNRMID